MPNRPVPARNLRNAWVWSIMTITIPTGVVRAFLSNIHVTVLNFRPARWFLKWWSLKWSVRLLTWSKNIILKFWKWNTPTAVSARYIFLAMLMPYPICMMRLSPALISLPLCCRIFCLTVTGCALLTIVGQRTGCPIWTGIRADRTWPIGRTRVRFNSTSWTPPWRAS